MFLSNTLNAPYVETGHANSVSFANANPVTAPESGRLCSKVFDDHFLKTALNIALYPIALIVTSVIIMGKSALQLSPQSISHSAHIAGPSHNALSPSWIRSVLIDDILTSVADLYISSAGGIYSHSVYVLYCIYYFLFGGRGIFFALVSLLLLVSLVMPKTGI
jgi:hypothetical protein